MPRSDLRERFSLLGRKVSDENPAAANLLTLTLESQKEVQRSRAYRPAAIGDPSEGARLSVKDPVKEITSLLTAAVSAEALEGSGWP